MNRFRAAIVAVLLAAVSATAHATVKAPPPPLEIAQKADVVFVGKVESVGEDSMRVVVGEVLKGGPKGVVVVRPIFQPECLSGMTEKRKPKFAAGDRIIVEATAAKDAYELVGGAMGCNAITSDAALAHAVSFVKEMVRIAALPDDAARRAAMIAHMHSKDPSYVDAALYFQFDELNTPEKSRPHVAALVAALDAPTARGRQAAMRALVGVAPPGALKRLIELTDGRDRDDADCACAALAPLDDERAVEAIFDASDREDAGVWLLHHLGASPRKEARARLRDLLFSRDAVDRKVAFTAYVQRFETFGATDEDVDDFLGVLARGVAQDEIYPVSNALIPTKSSRLAAALVELVRREDATPWQRSAAYRTLYEFATKQQMTDVVALLRKNEALFTRLLDDGRDDMYLHWILRTIHTPECKRCLERAMKRQDTETSHGDAWRTLYDWKD